MSGTVDTRTVEMRFDNKNFESNVKQSMSTLDKLKRKLKMDGASKGLKEIEKTSKKLEFKDLSGSIDNVGKKFSALETIATGVFLRIGMSAADVGAKIIKSFTIDQVSAGWNKYAQMTSATQTIMANLRDETGRWIDEASKMEYVNQQLDKLMTFSDETSYRFINMTQNVGKFVSSGLDLEEVVTAMEGIAGLAGLAGKTPEQAEIVFDTFSRAITRGYVSARDFYNIQTVMTAEAKEQAIAIGEELGLIEEGTVTISNFRDSFIGKGGKSWFNKDVMMKMLTKYGAGADYILAKVEELGVASTTVIKDLERLAESGDREAQEFVNSIGFRAFRADQEAKTFQEAMDATADAVSSRWSQIFKTIFGDYLEARKLWTDFSEDLYTIFVEPLNDLNEIMSMWSRGFKQGPLSALDIAYENKQLSKLDNIYRTVTKDIAEQAVAAHEAGDDVFYEIDTMADGSQRLIEYIRNASGEYEIFSRKIYDADKDLLSGRKLLLEGFRNIMEAFFLGWEEDVNGKVVEHLSVLGAVKKAFMEVFFPNLAAEKDGGKKTIAERLVELTKKFKEFTEKLKPIGDKLKNIFKGFFTVINMVRKFIMALIKPFKDVFSNLFGEVPDGVLGFADSISTWIQEFDKFLEKNKIFEKVSSGVKAGIDAISNALNWLSQTLTGLPLKDLVSTVKTKITEFFKNYDFKGHFENIGNFFSNIIGQIKQVETEDLPDKLTPLQNFWIGFKKIWEGIKKFFSLISVPFKKVGEFISNFFSGLSESIGGKQTEKSASKLQPIWEGIKKVFQGIVDFFEKIGPTLEKIGSWLGEKISSIGDAIGEFAKNHDAKEIIEWILKGGFIASLTDFFFSISGVFGGTGSILKSIKKDLDSVRGVLKAYQREINASTLLEVAMAIGVLAGSLWVLAQIPSDKLTQAGNALAIIAGSVAGFSVIKDVMKIFTQLSDKTNMGKNVTREGPLAGIKNILTTVVSTSIFANDATAKFVKICLGILLAALAILTVVKAMIKVADAFKALADIPPEVIEKGGKVMAQVMVAFGAFAMLAGTANRSTSALFAALGALILVFAIKKLIDAIADLGSNTEKMRNIRAAVDNFKDVFTAVGEIAKIIVGIGIGLAIIQTVIVAFASLGKQSSLGVSQIIKQFGKNFTRIALSLIIAAAAIAILASVAKNVSSNDWNAVSGFFIAFISIIGSLQALAVGLTSFGKRSGKYTADLMKQFGKNFIRIAASMLIIAAAFAIFKLINLDLGTLIVVGVLFAAIGTIVTILTKFAADMATKQKHLYFLENLKEIGKLFLKIAAALVLVAAAFAAFAVIGHYFGTTAFKIASWIFSIFAIIGLLLTWIATANATGEKGGAASAKSAAFVKNLKAISLVFVALAGSLLIVAGAFAIMSTLKFDKTPIWQIGLVFAVFMALAGFGAFALGKWLKDNNLEKTLYGLASYVAALAGALVVIAAAFKIMDSLKMESGTMWLVFGIFSLLMVVMGGIAWLTAKFVANDKLVKTLLGLSVYVLALSTSMVVIAAAFKIMDSLNMKPETLTQVAIIFGVLLLVIGAIGIAAGKLLTEATSWASIALIAGLIITAAGFLYIASLAIAKIADAIPLEKMEGVLYILIVLGSILAVMGIIATIAGASELGSVGLAAMAVLLIAFGGACWIAAKGAEILIAALSINGDKAAKNMLLISASMKQVLQDFKDSFGSIMLIPVALIAIGIGAAVAAVGLLLLALPVATISLLIITLIGSIENFIGTFSTFVDVVAVRGSAFVTNVSAVLNALLDAIITTGPKLRDAIYVVLTAFIDGITSALIDNIEKVANTVTIVIAVIAKSIADNAYMIRFAVVTTIMMCIMGILDALTENADPMMKSFVAFLQSLAIAIENNLGPMIEAGKGIAYALLKGIGDGLLSDANPLKKYKLELVDGALTVTKTGSGNGIGNSIKAVASETTTSEPTYTGGSSGGHSGKFGGNTTNEFLGFVEQMNEIWKDTPLGSIGSGESKLNFESIISSAQQGLSGLKDYFPSFDSMSLFGTKKEKSALDLAYERGELDALDNAYKTVSKSAAEAAVASHKAGDDIFYEIDTYRDGSQKLIEYIRNASGEYEIFSRDIYGKQSELSSLLNNLGLDDTTGFLGTIISGDPLPINFDFSSFYSELDKEHTITVTPVLASKTALDVEHATAEAGSTSNQYVSNDTYNNSFTINEASDSEKVANLVIGKMAKAVGRKQRVYE